MHPRRRVEHVLVGLRSVGWPLPPDDELPAAKGSTWLLTPKGECRYLPPPEVALVG